MQYFAYYTAQIILFIVAYSFTWWMTTWKSLEKENKQLLTYRNDHSGEIFILLAAC